MKKNSGDGCAHDRPPKNDRTLENGTPDPEGMWSCQWLFLVPLKGGTLPETNIMMVSNRNLLFQESIFRGYVSFRECR